MISDSERNAADIDYVSAHATSTPGGDKEEAAAIARLLGDGKKRANVSGIKSMTGHLLGGAGSLGAMAAVLAIYHGIVPPTINLEEPDEVAAGMDLVANEAREHRVDIVANNSFGFGGTNVTLVLKRHD